MHQPARVRFLRSASRICAGVVLPALVVPGCATAPPAATPLIAPAAAQAASLDTKVGWVLRLEAQRMLRDPGVMPDVVFAPLPAAPAAALPPAPALKPAATADLMALAVDPDAGLRRRAALALGRVGMADGLRALVPLLSDAAEPVRAMAAFAIGLVGDRQGVAPLQLALKDASALVRGRAVEGLGLIGEPSAAGAVADAAAGCAALLAPLAPDDEEWPKTPEIEICRLSLFALVRLRNYEALARVALDAQGLAVSQWWPVAFALQRSGDRRAAPALLTLVNSPGVHTAAFALRGLATLRDPAVVTPALAIAARSDADVRLRVAAVRALAQVGGSGAVGPLMRLVADAATPRNLALEAVAAVGALGDASAFDTMIDLVASPSPAVRAAALQAAARIDPEGFLLIISSFERDRDWSVRAALLATLSALDPERVRAAVEDLATDEDVRVRGAALEALARVKSPALTARLFAALEAPDFAGRAAAASLVGEHRPEGGAVRLVAAFTRGASDATPTARLAAIDALARYGIVDARETLIRALSDPEWPVRARAAALLRAAGVEAAPVRPAPLRQPAEFFTSDRLLRPPYSPHAFIDTAAGTIEIELNVVDAPLTSFSFIDLARAGFYNGLKVHRLVPGFVIQIGDPRGDGEGGPGFTIRDEFSPVPYLTGTVGMALAGPDTGGSQFFITVSPQPHLDGRYTVFGRVVQGFDVLDRISRWDVIDRIRIWDGVSGR